MHDINRILVMACRHDMAGSVREPAIMETLKLISSFQSRIEFHSIAEQIFRSGNEALVEACLAKIETLPKGDFFTPDLGQYSELPITPHWEGEVCKNAGILYKIFCGFENLTPDKILDAMGFPNHYPYPSAYRLFACLMLDGQDWSGVDPAFKVSYNSALLRSPGPMEDIQTLRMIGQSLDSNHPQFWEKTWRNHGSIVFISKLKKILDDATVLQIIVKHSLMGYGKIRANRKDFPPLSTHALFGLVKNFPDMHDPSTPSADEIKTITRLLKGL